MDAEQSEISVFVVLAASAQTAANSQSPPPEAAPARKAGITRMRLLRPWLTDCSLRKSNRCILSRPRIPHSGNGLSFTSSSTQQDVIFVKYVAGQETV